MLLSVRLQARVLYEKQKSLTIKLEASELKAKQREQQLLARDQDIGKMQEKIIDLEREVKLEKVRLNLTLKEIKRAAARENAELRNEMEKAAAQHENEKRALNKAVKEGQQETARMRNRLRESVRETAVVTNNFKTFYDDYSDLEKQLRTIESILGPLQIQIDELARSLNLEPDELVLRLEKLKRILKSDEDVGGLTEKIMKMVIDVGKNKETQKNSQIASTSVESSASASLTDPQPGSPSNVELNDPSCPLSQKVLPEQMDDPSHKEAEKKHLAVRRRMMRLNFGFKLPNWPGKQFKSG